MIYNCKVRKTILFRYVRHSIRLFMFFHSKFHFVHNCLKPMLKAVLVLFGLSLVWNRYPKVCHMAGATKRSIIAFDKLNLQKE